MTKPILRIIRMAQGVSTTLGQLHIYDEQLKEYTFICYVLEDTLRKEKIKRVTAIPSGVHLLRIRTESPLVNRYKENYSFVKHGLIEVLTPTFQGTYIHIGNDAEDTEGCPLVGMLFRYDRTKKDYQLLHSTAALERLMKIEPLIEKIKSGGQKIDIINHPKLRVL